jgi:pimeloyl-ACP methyl ester carboxylesterase
MSKLPFFLLLFPAAILAQPALDDRQIDAGGTTFHLRCSGERAANAPTVILEAGAGGTTDAWQPVHAAIAGFARVCAYDRPGSGASGPALTGLSPAGYVDLLRSVFIKAGEPPPYVLTGHSFGGQIAALFAMQYPADVAGLVLVDASHEDQQRRYDALPQAPPPPGWKAGVPPPPPAGVTPRDFAAALRARRWTTAAPLVVLTAGQFPGLDADPNADAIRKIWSELQRDLATRSPQSQHIIASGSGHLIQRDAPQVVIDAVRRVLSLHRAALPKPK